jgi:hypothetical protein
MYIYHCNIVVDSSTVNERIVQLPELELDRRVRILTHEAAGAFRIHVFLTGHYRK